MQCGSARHLPSSGARWRQALLGGGGLRPLHTRPERRAGRRRPFWHIAAGCAAGCVKARGVVLGVSSLYRFRVSPGGRACRDPDRSWWGSERTYFLVNFRLDGSTHQPESVIRFCVGDCSSRVLQRKFGSKSRPLTRNFMTVDCDTSRNHASRRARFTSMRRVRRSVIYTKETKVGLPSGGWLAPA